MYFFWCINQWVIQYGYTFNSINKENGCLYSYNAKKNILYNAKIYIFIYIVIKTKI